MISEDITFKITNHLLFATIMTRQLLDNVITCLLLLPLLVLTKQTEVQHQYIQMKPNTLTKSRFQGKNQIHASMFENVCIAWEN